MNSQGRKKGGVGDCVEEHWLCPRNMIEAGFWGEGRGGRGSICRIFVGNFICKYHIFLFCTVWRRRHIVKHIGYCQIGGQMVEDTDYRYR